MDRRQIYYFNVGGKVVNSHYTKLFFAFVSTLFLVSMLVVVVLPVLGSEEFVWEGSVPASGDPVVSPILWQGVSYRIVVAMTWWYDKPANLAADAQYYTTDFTNSWQWGNSAPEPNGHSFLQINEQDVDWGPFSNGDTGHTYEIYYEGEEAPITFRLVDWMDGNYANNVCHLRVRIYKETTVGGYIVGSNLWDFAPLLGALTFAIIITVPVISYLRKSYFQNG
jgi:hypothetical protein